MLTARGREQMRQLGAQLRQDLCKKDGGGLLPYVWPVDRHEGQAQNLQVTTTPFPRTVQSVQSLLLGLYPNDSRERISGDGRRAVVPVSTLDGFDMVPDHDESEEQKAKT